MYNIGQHVVHLSHGVGTIRRIEHRQFSTDKPIAEFYVIEIDDNGAPKTVFVPVDSASDRLRSLVTIDAARSVLEYVQDRALVHFDQQTWNQRYREYMALLHTGELQNVAKVFKALRILKQDKDLSFGEHKLLAQAQRLLSTELSLVLPGFKANYLD